jgi:hypothetical protein
VAPMRGRAITNHDDLLALLAEELR